MTKRLLLIDGLNAFYRNYTANPSISTNGVPVGGVIGFMKSINMYCREMKPDQVIVIWDGHNASKSRRKLNENYKQGRKTVRLNRDVQVLTEEQEQENKMWQFTRICQYLNETPIVQVMLDGVEADDVIAYYTKHYKKYDDWVKIIISSDKDFYQLLDDKTVIYRSSKKEFVSRKNIIEEYGIHPNNFALARALAGDSSDNIKGVSRIGLPTVSKRFPFMVEEKHHSINRLLEHCKSFPEKKRLKVYNTLLKEKSIAKDNYKLMQLYDSNLRPRQVKEIKDIMGSFDFSCKKTTIMVMFEKDGIEDVNLHDMFAAFKRMKRDNN